MAVDSVVLFVLAAVLSGEIIGLWVALEDSSVGLVSKLGIINSGIIFFSSAWLLESLLDSSI